MQASWHGNATLKLTAENGTSIVFDPFFSRNPNIKPFELKDIENVSAILVTHGHFDHVADLPFISSKLRKEIYAPEEVAHNLSSRLGVPVEFLHNADYGNETQIGAFKIKPFKSRHVKFDLPLIASTLAGLVKNMNRDSLARLKRNMSDHLRMPMGRCIGWLVEADGRSLLHFGSMAFDEHEHYPQNVDVLSLPFQGNSQVDLLALSAVERLKPEAVLLHHFDDAFPPISSAVETATFASLMKQKHPQITVYIPDYDQPITL